MLNPMNVNQEPIPARSSVDEEGNAVQMFSAEHDIIRDYITAGARNADQLPIEDLAAVADYLADAHRRRSNVYVFGNGACAALASHMAADLGKALVSERFPPSHPISVSGQRLMISALTDNASFMTAIGNDLHYEDVFLEQLRTLLRPDDVVIGLSASGTSPNVLRALEFARAANARTVCFTGQLVEEPAILELADLSVVAPSSSIDTVEDLHVVFHHAVVRAYKFAISARKEEFVYA